MKNDFKTDEELMVDYQMGEVLAFDILFRRHSSRVLAFLSKKLNFSKEAQDLTQEVFFKLHRSKHLYNSTLPFSPWLFSISRSVLLDYLKKNRREEVVDPTQFESVPSKETSSSVADAEKEMLGALPLNQKRAVGLRVFDDATFEEIASKLSTSEANARKLVSRGLSKLREIWKKGQNGFR